MSNRRDPRTSGYMRIGDVLLLNWGMFVYWPECPKYFNSYRSPYALGTENMMVQIGVPVKREPSIEYLRKELSDGIKQMFRFRNIPLDDYILERFIANQVPLLKVTTCMIPVGLYRIADILPGARTNQIILKTYKPGPSRPEYEVYIDQGNYNPTHIDIPQVVTNPDEAVEAGWG